MDSSQDRPSLALLKTLLRSILRITISDGRIFLGTFVGTDKQLNILLVNTDEYRFTPVENANPNGRYVALVMVPRRLIVKVEAQGREGLADEDGYGSDMYM